MGINRVFTSYIHHKALLGSRSGLIQDLISECDIIRRKDRQGLAWSKKNYRRGFTSYGSLDQLHRLSPHFAELSQKIDREVANYTQKLGLVLRKGDLKLSRMWVNIMGQGCTHAFHIHPLSVVSGTFYLSASSDSSPIKFEDPRLSHFMNRPMVRPYAARELQPFIQLQPKRGDLVLFESWMKHEVPPNPSREERISVSFNYDW